MRRIKALFNKIKNGERGAIVAEATIALTAFIFAIFIILSIVDVCYVQAKMGIALNTAAKEMSQYAYLYDALGLSEYMSGTGGKSSEFMQKTFAVVLKKLSNGTANLSDEISGMFATASNQAGGDSGAEYLKNGLGMGLAKALVQKNLVSYEGQNADAFLRSLHVKDGLSGLNFLNTTFLTDKDQSKVNLIVYYEVEVLRLLDTRFTFNFVQRAETKAWGSSASKSSGSSSSSIWDISDVTRGNSIITSEKKNYTYTSSSHNFHAYVPKNNQFVRIRTLDTYEKSYAGNSSAIESALNQSYNNLKNGVENLGEAITVQNGAGKDVTVNSKPGTRTYKIVLVVPDSSDMTTVNQAISDFKADNPGVSVEVKTGYGDPAAATESPTETQAAA